MSAPPSFTCPQCGRTSYNANDVRERYCGNCHDWTGVKEATAKAVVDDLAQVGMRAYSQQVETMIMFAALVEAAGGRIEVSNQILTRVHARELTAFRVDGEDSIVFTTRSVE